MNKILISCNKNQFQDIVKQIIDAVQMMNHLDAELSDVSIVLINKYYRTTLLFVHTDSTDLSDKNYDGYILFQQPEKMPSEDHKENIVFIAAKIKNEDQIGLYDVSDWIFDYFIDIDELGALLGEVAFNNYEELVKNQDKEQVENGDDDFSIQKMLNEIKDPIIKEETKKFIRLFENMRQDKDDAESFATIFGSIDVFKQLLQTASEQDRRNAAGIISLCMSQELE